MGWPSSDGSALRSNTCFGSEAPVTTMSAARDATLGPAVHRQGSRSNLAWTRDCYSPVSIRYYHQLSNELFCHERPLSFVKSRQAIDACYKWLECSCFNVVVKPPES